MIVVLTPTLLVHLVEKALLCCSARCVQTVTAAVIAEADELPEPISYTIATAVIARLHAGGMQPFVELAWRDALAAVRRQGLNLDVPA